MVTNFYIGCEDYFGKDTTPDDLFNDKLIPLLKRYGIKSDTKLNEIARIVRDISEASYSNGADNAECEIIIGC